MTNFLKHSLTKKTLLALSSGVLLSLAYGVPVLWFIGFVALIPLLFVLKNTQSRKGLFLWSFVVGTLYYGSVFSFYFNAHPILWLKGEETSASVLLIFLVWALCVFLFSFFLGLWGSLSRKTLRTPQSAIFVASLWVLMEWAQSLGLSFVSWNTDALIGSHLTFGFVGYALAEYPLFLSLASLGGVYLLSFVVVLFNGLLFRLTHKENWNERRFLEFGFFVTLLFFVSATLFSINKEDLRGTETARVASLYTTFKTFFSTNPEAEILRTIQIGSLLDAIMYEEKHPDVIVLPENTRYLTSLSSEKRKALVSRLSSVKRVVIIDSHRSFDTEKNAHTAVLEFETGAGNTESYTKRLLVPSAEYMPLVIRLATDLSLGKDWDEFFETHVALKKGARATLGTHGNLRLGSLFCSEALSPGLYRETVRLGANLLTNSASHALLRDSESLYRQIVKFSKTRAAENNRFYVQSGNSVPSFVINNHGELLGETRRDANTLLYTDVSLISKMTLASKTGEWWIVLFVFISLVDLAKRKTYGNDKKPYYAE